MAEATEHTQRGFAIYARLTDTRGHDIRVQESSAFNAAVWVFISASTMPGVDFRDLHLDAGQARQLRDALDAFIAHHGEADPPVCVHCGERNPDGSHNEHDQTWMCAPCHIAAARGEER